MSQRQISLERPRKSRARDLTGDKFGRLHVIRWVGVRGKGHHFWLCHCDCGNTIEVATSNLRGGQVSCGCAKRDVLIARNTTHGLRKTHPLYTTWQTMHKRCRNPNNHKYPDYGGRGIRVCERWTGPDGFVHFASDMGDRPSLSHSVDRIDNDGDYEPTNCRWATVAQQNRNRRPRRTLRELHSQIAALQEQVDEYRRRFGPLESER